MNSDVLALPARTAKPREQGLTAITDLGTPIAELRSILEDFHEFIDVAKLGVGSAYVAPRLREKIELYKGYGVQVYFGGTLFEKYLNQDRLPAYFTLLSDYGVDWIEVSCGIVTTPLEARVDLVERARNDQGLKVLSEVGSKDGTTIMPPSVWIREITALLAAGSSYVITEGRDSGTAGIFRPSGEIREGLLSDILSAVDPARLVFEAPHAKSQMYFINLVGPNVNLGNVAVSDLLLLETQRRGLRNETFGVA